MDFEDVNLYLVKFVYDVAEGYIRKAVLISGIHEDDVRITLREKLYDWDITPRGAADVEDIQKIGFLYRDNFK